VRLYFPNQPSESELHLNCHESIQPWIMIHDSDAWWYDSHDEKYHWAGWQTSIPVGIWLITWFDKFGSVLIYSYNTMVQLMEIYPIYLPLSVRRNCFNLIIINII
jgi:hypothetical protein